MSYNYYSSNGDELRNLTEEYKELTND